MARAASVPGTWWQNVGNAASPYVGYADPLPPLASSSCMILRTRHHHHRRLHLGLSQVGQSRPRSARTVLTVLPLPAQNCTIKQPPNNAMKDRHRRLCMACVEAPLAALLSPALHSDTPFQSDEVQRELCQCDQRAGVWLCQPCGRGIRASDSDYLRFVMLTASFSSWPR